MSRLQTTLVLFIAMGSAMAVTACASKDGAQDAPLVSAQSFATPEDAVVALIDASRSGNYDRLVPIFGSGIAGYGAETREQTEGDMQRLAAAYDRAHNLVQDEDGTVTLQVGKDKWEFPAPLVKSGSSWRFDTEAGLEELRARRIDDNQTETVEMLAECVLAQRRFRAMNTAGSATPAFAARFNSTPGKRDGLWWPDDIGSPLSPLGPTVAAAMEAGELDRDVSKIRSFHGYRMRILDAQGASAPGGARSYRGADGRLTEGFAIIAWPLTYNQTGIMSFVVSADGGVFENDLGPETEAMARAVGGFDPGDGWSRVQSGQ